MSSEFQDAAAHWRELSANLGSLGMLALGYVLLMQMRLQPAREHWRDWLAGALFGLAGVLVQLSPVLLAQGVRIDPRAVVLGLAGAYLPWPAALLASLPALAYRLQLGGPGLVAGMALLVAALLLGLLWRALRRHLPRSWLWLLSLGLALAAATAALVTLVPGVDAALAGRVALRVVPLYSLGTLLLGLMLELVQQQDRQLAQLQRALRAHRLSETKLELALGASGSSMWEWQVPERRLRFSADYPEALGYGPQMREQTPQSFLSLVHPDDVAALNAASRDALRADGIYAAEFRVRDALGRWRWMLARGRLVQRGPQGEPLLMVGTQLDVDLLRRQQAAQLEANERFQKIYQTTPDAMGVTRIADGCYIDVNEGFSRVTGYAREAVLGRTSVEVGVWLLPEQRSALIEAFQRDGSVDSMEMLVRHREGQVVRGLMSVRRLTQDGEACMLFIYRDITERERLRDEAEAARHAQTTAALANQAKTEFLSRMSHELRTPLNAVLGFAQLLQASPRLAPGSSERERVDMIAQAGWHLLNLINDVLDISRIESGQLQLQLQRVALAPLLAESIGLLQGQAEAAGVALDPVPAGAERLLQSDPLRLRQALLNLLGNAVKYNRRGGRVSLRVEPAQRCLRLLIADTGIGMNAQQLAHLFEPFNRLGREYEGIEGAGIGLVLTKHLLELMGARLQIASRAGEGTTATLELPLAEAALPAPQPAPPPSVAAGASPAGRVLYIEDNEANQAMVRGMLQDWPALELRIAADAGQGLREARDWRPALILLDLRLPDMDGLQLLALLKAEPALAAIPVVAVSAGAMPEELERALRAGASEYWTKPLRLEQFRADMRRVLGAAQAAHR
ncbi:MAG: ATP-binding protein [Burkholderiaceae bacterium]